MAKKRSEPDAGPDAEQPFPRGGASLLTPLERRKLKLQAEADFKGESIRPDKAAKKHKADAFAADTDEVQSRTCFNAEQSESPTDRCACSVSYTICDTP